MFVFVCAAVTGRHSGAHSSRSNLSIFHISHVSDPDSIAMFCVALAMTFQCEVVVFRCATHSQCCVYIAFFMHTVKSG